MPTNLAFQGGGSPPVFGTGRFGQALQGGTLASVAIAGKVPASGDFTIALWIKGTGNGIPIGQSSACYIYVQNGLLTAQYGNGGTSVALNSSVNVADGAWHYVELVFGSAGGALWCDGVRVASSATTTSAAGMDRTGGTLFVGSFGGTDFVYGGLMDDIAIYTTALRTGSTSYTVPSAPVANNAANIDRLWHLNGDGVDSAGAAAPGMTILPNNAAILYSPANWVLGSTAKSICAGAYFKVGFTGATCALTFDVSAMTGAKSRIAYRVDGQLGYTVVDAAASVTIPIPAGTANRPVHLLEVVLEATSAEVNRWGATSQSALILTGIVLDAAASVVAPVRRARTVWIYADSIGEGVLAGNRDSATDALANSAVSAWALDLGAALGAEVGVIAFGSLGYTAVGRGGVPVLPDSYALIMEGQARSFSPAPDLIIDNLGTNDGGSASATIRSAVALFLTRLLSSLGASATTRVVVLGTLSTVLDTDRAAAVATVNDPRVTFVSASGVYGTSFDAGDIHPSGAAAKARIVPGLTDKLLPYAQPRRFTVTVG